MTPAIQSAPGSVPAPETLGALQQSWAYAAPRLVEEVPRTPAPALDPAPTPQRLPFRDSFLSLRDVPQIPFEQARGAFPMSELGYSTEWKDQVRQLRNRLNNAQAE